MDSFEREAAGEGYNLIAGVDEVGRGPLAGPVVAGAVVFSEPFPLELGITDSKRLSPARREALLIEINRRAIATGIGIVWPVEIDTINILNASLKAMTLALDSLEPAGGASALEGGCEIRPDFVLVDGPKSIPTSFPQRAIIGGDTKSISIAAASIVAKTCRDRIMTDYHSIYPEYNFPGHKGYGTKEHRRAIKEFGPTPIHRMSFKLL